jgi:hypothetical protein
MSRQPQNVSDREDEEDSPSAVDTRALDELFSRLYNEIHLLASRVRWRGANPTLNPTALVNEAYLKLTRNPSELASKSYEEAIAIFANAMRQILVDAARRKNAQKRLPVGLPVKPQLPVEDMIALDTALGELEQENPLQFRVVNAGFFWV